VPIINFSGQEQPQLEFRGFFEDGIIDWVCGNGHDRARDPRHDETHRSPPLAFGQLATISKLRCVDRSFLSLARLPVESG